MDMISGLEGRVLNAKLQGCALVATFIKVFDTGLANGIDDLRPYIRYYGVVEEDLGSVALAHD